jgi:LmbE family N-acetylglucosaminyl deacetylase
LECRYKYTYLTCTRCENERQGEEEVVEASGTFLRREREKEREEAAAASGTFLRKRKVVYLVQSKLSLVVYN